MKKIPIPFNPQDSAVYLREQYRLAQPFPHCVLDNVLSPGFVEELIHEWPDLSSAVWGHNLKPTGDKFGAPFPAQLGPTIQRVIAFFNGKVFVNFLSFLSDVPKLEADRRDKLGGAGLHEMRQGGFLDVHVDFNRMDKESGPYRRLNFFLFLNPGWREEYGGNLELWNEKECVRRIVPVSNRIVVFSTSERSWHGNPRPVNHPHGSTRKSIALYYYSSEPAPGWTGQAHGTIYREKP